MNNIKWRKVRNKAVDNTIEKVENRLDVVLPSDLRDCILEFNGGRPTPYLFDFSDRKQVVFANLLDFSLMKEINVLSIYESVKNRMIELVYPIASEPGGDLICLDYREGKDKTPKIAYWDHELAFEDPATAIFYICDTFTELLSKLYESEE